MPSPETSERTARQIRWLNNLRLVLSAAAVALIIVGLFVMRERGRTRGWATAEGKVAASFVNEFRGKDGVSYRPMVMYGYTIGAARYMSNRIGFRTVRSSRRADAERMLSKYPVGKAVQVTYNPSDPEQAVLEPAGNAWLWIGAGGVLSMLTVWTRMRRGRLEKRDG